jgi:hypothetical protein
MRIFRESYISNPFIDSAGPTPHPSSTMNNPAPDVEHTDSIESHDSNGKPTEKKKSRRPASEYPSERRRSLRPRRFRSVVVDDNNDDNDSCRE